jgi:hypothetical protein
MWDMKTGKTKHTENVTRVYISRERTISEPEGQKSEAQAKEDIKWRAIINLPLPLPKQRARQSDST